MPLVLTTSDDRVDLHDRMRYDINDSQQPGTAKGLSFDGSTGIDTIASDHPYGSYFSVTSDAFGLITVTSASGSAKFSNFEKISWYGGVSINLGTAGDDVLTGGGKDDKFLFGLAGHDTIMGLKGADWISGGADQDILTGGAGADKYIYFAVTDSGATSDTHDIIQGFRPTVDRIDLRAIDANSNDAVNQAFKFIGTKPFHHLAGELHALKSAGVTLIQADVNGDAIADFEIQLNGLKTLTKIDFIL